MIQYEGIVINTKSFSNTSLIVNVLTNNRIVSGLAKGARKKNIYNLGNYLKLKWFGREGALGIFDAEIVKPYGLTSDNFFILILLVISLEINYFLDNNFFHTTNIYDSYLECLDSFYDKNYDNTFFLFLHLESKILRETGLTDLNTIDYNINTKTIIELDKKDNTRKMDQKIIIFRERLHKMVAGAGFEPATSRL